MEFWFICPDSCMVHREGRRDSCYYPVPTLTRVVDISHDPDKHFIFTLCGMGCLTVLHGWDYITLLVALFTDCSSTKHSGAYNRNCYHLRWILGLHILCLPFCQTELSLLTAISCCSECYFMDFFLNTLSFSNKQCS